MCTSSCKYLYKYYVWTTLLSWFTCRKMFKLPETLHYWFCRSYHVWEGLFLRIPHWRSPSEIPTTGWLWQVFTEQVSIVEWPLTLRVHQCVMLQHLINFYWFIDHDWTKQTIICCRCHVWYRYMQFTFLIINPWYCAVQIPDRICVIKFLVVLHENHEENVVTIT